MHVKDDFNPFKHHKVIEAAQVGQCPAARSLLYRSGARSQFAFSPHLAVQREALHADVPPHAEPAAAALPARRPARAPAAAPVPAAPTGAPGRAAPDSAERRQALRAAAAAGAG